MIPFKDKSVLILAPHTDDGELGLGGTIAKIVEEGATVYYIAFSIAEESVPEGFAKDILATEVANATQILGIPEANLFIYKFPVRKLNYQRQEILELLVEKRKELNPDIIFTPTTLDVHQDHEAVTKEAIRAFKRKTILGYELIWNNLSVANPLFIRLDEKHIRSKVNALAAYASQGKRNYLSSDFIFALATTRGVQIGSEYAESFEAIRIVI